MGFCNMFTVFSELRLIFQVMSFLSNLIFCVLFIKITLIHKPSHKAFFLQVLYVMTFNYMNFMLILTI